MGEWCCNGGFVLFVGLFSGWVTGDACGVFKGCARCLSVGDLDFSVMALQYKVLWWFVIVVTVQREFRALERGLGNQFRGIWG